MKLTNNKRKEVRLNANPDLVYECMDCQFEEDINYIPDVSTASDCDTDPVAKCPKCGGYCIKKT